MLLGPLGVACRNESGRPSDALARPPATNTAPDSVATALATASAAAPEVGVTRHHGFVDIAFGLQEVSRDAQGFKVRAHGRHDGALLALRLESVGAWTPVNVGADVAHVVCRGSVAIAGDGAAGDAFLRSLDELYATGLAPQHLRPTTFFAATAPCEALHEPGPVRLELRLASSRSPGVEPGEWTALIDEPTRRFELRERDPLYRAPIVRALSAE